MLSLRSIQVNSEILKRLRTGESSISVTLVLIFSTSLQYKKRCFSMNWKSKTGVPMLKSGVILTAQLDKAKGLEFILSRINYYPKTIIFIDDMLNNLESIERLISKLKIKFHRLHYTAVSSVPMSVINEKIEKLRFQILKKGHEWLDYQELIGKNSSLTE